MAECPKCKGNFNLEMRKLLLGGRNDEGNWYFIYYKICPSCDDMIIILRKYKSLAEANFYDPEDVITNGEFIHPRAE